MVINDDKKFIFVHVYKNGGCSIEKALGGITMVPGFKKSMHLTPNDLPETPDRTDYFTFAFVRNPWDRLVASFTFQNHNSISGSTFRNHVRSLTSDKKKFAQYNMVKDCSFIGRFEHMAQDFKVACDLIGMGNVKLPHINKSAHTHYAQYYTDEIKDLAYNFTSGDVDHFGFTFEGTATKNVGDMR